MSIKFTYRNTDYESPWAVRQAIFRQENKVFGPYPEDETGWAALGVTLTTVADPEPILPTEEELAAQALDEARNERAQAVKAITVTVDGMVFNGDETSQSRMTRALQVAEITGMKSTQWVLADNTVATVTVEQMKSALSQAMLKQSELWVLPYAAS